MVDIDSLRETHHEQFICRCQDNYDLNALVIEAFADHIDWYYIKESGEAPEEMYDNAFDYLYDYDAEGLFYNPILCVQSFIDWKRWEKLAH